MCKIKQSTQRHRLTDWRLTDWIKMATLQYSQQTIEWLQKQQSQKHNKTQNIAFELKIFYCRLLLRQKINSFKKCLLFLFLIARRLSSFVRMFICLLLILNFPFLCINQHFEAHLKQLNYLNECVCVCVYVYRQSLCELGCTSRQVISIKQF